MNWLALLLAFLFPAVDEPPEGGADADASSDDATDDDPDGTAGGGDDDAADPDKPDDKPDATLARVTEAERVAREAQEQVQRLQAQAAQKPDPIADEEERKLRDPNTTDLEKWQIQSNRALRASQQQSQQALWQAQDMADKTAYITKGLSNPVYDKYKDRVESELAKARANNSNVPREVILQLLIGRDMLAGQFKAKDKPAAVNRGKPNSARSDTPRRGAQTEHDKRRARLENQIL